MSRFPYLRLVGILLLVGLAAFGLARLAANRHLFRSGSTSQQAQAGGPNYAALPACTKDLHPLTALPMDSGSLDGIIPLGAVLVPDHIFPADHLYFLLKQGDGQAAPVNLLSPGHMVVVSIQRGQETGLGKQGADDYGIIAAPCRGLTLSFGHVQTLTGRLAAAAKAGEKGAACQQQTSTIGTKVLTCTQTADLSLDPGELMGTVGGRPGVISFDLGSSDASLKNPGYIDPRRYPNPTATCPIAYFDAAGQKALLGKMRRTQEPLCGEIAQDVKGTAQGGWSAGTDPVQTVSDWSSHLSLVHLNTDPTVGVLGVGGRIASPMILYFAPRQQGAVNREPKQITPGTALYCYQDETSVPGRPNGRVLVQLPTENTLKAEYQQGDCSGDLKFTNPVEYYR